ncbi:unnamed protein product [Blepharisma stoltei]|uniref:Transmembrane protein n=1 Tax=Blepharisma stoltei TaxID=1481888 RepID=A0AAU9JQR2_9CILI|nr:unnamed protein product [Blepharisma stoltei]
MNCCLPTGLGPNPSQEATKLFKILKLIIIIQITLAIFQFFADVWNGIMMLIGALILFLAIRNSNWCSCVVYIVLTLMDLFSSINFCGEVLFTSQYSITAESGFIYFFILIKLPFYIVSLYYTFLSYKELKALFLTSQGGGQSYELESGWNFAQNSNNQRNEQQFFSGQGYRLG